MDVVCGRHDGGGGGGTVQDPFTTCTWLLYGHIQYIHLPAVHSAFPSVMKCVRVCVRTCVRVCVHV